MYKRQYLYYGYNLETALSKIGNLSSEEREEVSAKFSVEGYQMELKIDRELHADVTVTLSDAQEQEEYVFTLYRGYHLQTLTDHLGNQLSWEQEGDWIRFSPVVSGTTAFRFSYSGSGDMFYSNRQGIFLPGYFPFYPMPGEKVVNDGLGFMTPIDRSQKQFEVTVHTDAPNLNCKMCIRDRLHVLPLDGEGGRLPVEGNLQDVFVVVLHHHHQPLVLAGLEQQPPRRGDEDDPQPVSYTHLDVYKRQPAGSTPTCGSPSCSGRSPRSAG